MTTRPRAPKKEFNWKAVAIVLSVALLALLAFGVTYYFATNDDEPQAAQVTTSSTSVQATTTTMVSTTTPTKSTRTTQPSTSSATRAAETYPSTTTSSKTRPAPPEADGMDEMFNRMYLPVKSNGWEQWKEVSNDFRKVYINTATCGSTGYKEGCAGFAVFNLDAKPRGGVDPTTQKPYDDNPADAKVEGKSPEGQPNCYWNQVTDNAYYGVPQHLTPKVVYGGSALVHSMQPGCQFRDYQHSWRSDSRGVIIYDINPLSPDPTGGLEALLSKVVWG